MRHSWIIWMAICLHTIWGSLILANPKLAVLLPVFLAEFLGPARVAAGIIIGCALLATAGLLWEARPTLRGLFLLHPQQFVLTASSISTVLFIVNDLPEGTSVLRAVFILLPVLLATLFHTFAVVDGYSAGGWRVIRQTLSRVRRRD